jgi:hypothetical protein
MLPATTLSETILKLLDGIVRTTLLTVGCDDHSYVRTRMDTLLFRLLRKENVLLTY